MYSRLHKNNYDYTRFSGTENLNTGLMSSDLQVRRLITNNDLIVYVRMILIISYCAYSRHNNRERNMIIKIRLDAYIDLLEYNCIFFVLINCSIKLYLRSDSFGDGGPGVFLKLFRVFSDEMSIRRSSCGVEYFRRGANFR